MFTDFDFTGFWDGEPVCGPLTGELTASVQAELGYRLPESYLWLMGRHNGGIPARTCCMLPGGRDWVELCSIFGVGREVPDSLCGENGARLARDWGYPDIGVALCDCPSAGHELIFLDYRACGPEGEPAVVHVDQEMDYNITPLAENFEQFIRGLCTEEEAERRADTSKARSEAAQPVRRSLLGRLFGMK